MYICLCKGLTENQFQQIVQTRGYSPEAVKQACGFNDSCCGRCEERLEELMAEALQ